MLSVEIIIVAALIVTNGLLAMSELAIVSARPARLKTMRDKGVRGAARALKLAADPGRFLSTVQIGITLVGVLSGAFSGATLGTRLAGFLAEAGISEGMADAAGVGIVVALITYASLIIGELVPKQIALRDPEGIAARMAPAMTLLATVAMPLVWFLDISGRAVLFVLGQRSEGSSGVSDEEIRMIIAEAEGAGVIEPGEGDMMEGVMRLADRTVRALMTPRRQVEWLEKDADEDALREALLAAEHSYLPVAGKELDEMAGVVRTRDLLRPAFEKKPIRLEKHLLKAPVVHDRASALDVLARGATAVAEVGEDRVLINSLAPRPAMYVFGAIDHAAAVAEIGRRCAALLRGEHAGHRSAHVHARPHRRDPAVRAAHRRHGRRRSHPGIGPLATGCECHGRATHQQGGRRIARGHLAARRSRDERMRR